ncbi:MAG: hypothetical protein JXN63_04920 [Candidatus Delongbacteria bacterium]|nr:hypothetical protein [Candidatus Delongbacteria bacterium]
MNIKNIFFSALITLLVISCEKDIPVQTTADKYANFDRDMSVIPDRIQFGIDKIYHIKISFDTNYSAADGFKASAFFFKDSEVIEIPLYDDGFSDDSLRNDLAASNNIWSGGINALDFTGEGEWPLYVESYLYNELIETYQPVAGILVKNNTAPAIDQISGIAENDTLSSGFEPLTLAIEINDPDNDESGYNDNQTLRLEIRNRDNIPKDYDFVRSDPLSDMMITLDSTLAAGLSTNDRYKLTFIATDLYGEKDSLSFDNIRIENTAPSVNNLQYPDTVFIPAQDSIYFSIEVNVNDPQGHLESQDIDRVEMSIPSLSFTAPLRDDGDFFTSGDDEVNDGIYTISFWVTSTNEEAVYPFGIIAEDKAGNISSEINGTLIFTAGGKKYVIRGSNETNLDYFNPFNIR